MAMSHAGIKQLRLTIFRKFPVTIKNTFVAWTCLHFLLLKFQDIAQNWKLFPTFFRGIVSTWIYTSFGQSCNFEVWTVYQKRNSWESFIILHSYWRIGCQFQKLMPFFLKLTAYLAINILLQILTILILLIFLTNILDSFRFVRIPYNSWWLLLVPYDP